MEKRIQALEEIINEHFNHIQELSADNASPALKEAVSQTLNQLNEGAMLKRNLQVVYRSYRTHHF